MLTKDKNTNINTKDSNEQKIKQKGRVSMPLAQQKLYTIEDIYALPDGQRAELIDGQIYMMAPPNRAHQKILLELSYLITSYVKGNRGSCEIYPAPFAVYLDEHTHTYVEPDISVVCDKNKLNDKGCIGAPDWIIEIVSPSSRHMDYLTKLFKYRTAGVREYWIVDYAKNRILVYNFEQEETGDYTFSDVVTSGIYSDLSIDFSQIDI